MLNKPANASSLSASASAARGEFTIDRVHLVFALQFLARGGKPWGSLSFVNATGPSVISNLVVRGASLSRKDPVKLKAAVAACNSTVVLEGLDIEAPQPVFTRFGSTTLRNSRIHSQFTGDGVNIKFGAGIVENCVFTGSPTPDTDAIDFDGVLNGVIRGNRGRTQRRAGVSGLPGILVDSPVLFSTTYANTNHRMSLLPLESLVWNYWWSWAPDGALPSPS